MEAASVEALIADLFRRESSRLISALARLLGPSKLALAEDVVQDRSDSELTGAVELALSPEADAENQLAMMFAIGDDALSPETHVWAASTT